MSTCAGRRAGLVAAVLALTGAGCACPRPATDVNPTSELGWERIDARGGLDEPEMRSALQGLMPGIRACRESARTCAPPHGFLVVHLAVAPDGAVPSVGFDNSVSMAEKVAFEPCLTRVFRGARFPARSVPSEVSSVLAFGEGPFVADPRCARPPEPPAGSP